jgi:hypothetical protein
VDHQIPVRVSDCVQNLADKAQAFANGVMASVAKAIQVFAFDILHDQVRFALGGQPAVQQHRDVGMLQLGQNLALEEKSPSVVLGARGRAQHFDGDLLLKVAVVAARAVYQPAASTGE